MSKMRKCDRCGKAYGFFNSKECFKPSMRLKVFDRDALGKKYAKHSYDLCHKCSGKLMNFLYMEKEKNNE